MILIVLLSLLVWLAGCAVPLPATQQCRWQPIFICAPAHNEDGD